MREFGSEHSAVLLPDGYFGSFETLGREVLYLQSGREALLLAALSVCNKEKKTILFPSYCCWSMSAPFKNSGWNLAYYRLNEDLTVNLEFLANLLETVEADAILTMNFYGSACTDEAVTLAKSKNVVVIEDFSHCTFSFKQIFNPDVDVYVSSIRKSVGVSDGAVLLSKEAMKTELMGNGSPEFSDRRFDAQKSKWEYLFSKDIASKNIFLSEIRECEDVLNDFSIVEPISHRAKQMLSLINGNSIAYARRQNMKHLMERLAGNVRMVRGLERCLEGAPFSLPILVENRDCVQKQLAEAGVYAPVLWPISEEAASVCPVSKVISEQMLSIPIDQRYNWDDIEDIATRVIQICCK